MNKRWWVKPDRRNPATYNTLILPGEPFIYSAKYRIGCRWRTTAQYLQGRQWKPILKCFFRTHFKVKTPIVILVKFFLTPPKREKVTKKELREETRPAVLCFEICDYVLHFLDFLHKTLINQHRQIVKMDMEKIYSDTPRIEFKYMTHEEYLELRNNNTILTESQSFCPSRETRAKLQSKRTGDAINSEIRATTISAETDTDPCFHEPYICDSTLPSSPARLNQGRKTRSAKLPTSRDKARQRQSDEVSGGCTEGDSLEGRLSDSMDVTEQELDE